jgi:hypothetical protein
MEMCVETTKIIIICRQPFLMYITIDEKHPGNVEYDSGTGNVEYDSGTGDVEYDSGTGNVEYDSGR